MFPTFGERVAAVLADWAQRLDPDLKAEIAQLKKDFSMKDFVESPKPKMLLPYVRSPRSEEYLYVDGTGAHIRAAFRFGHIWLKSRRH